MYQLNLPGFEVRLQKENGRLLIYDIIRKKFILLTPEEWVRQHFVHFLLGQGYPLSLISIERGHKYQRQLAKRSDLLVYDRQLSAFLLVECKAPSVRLDEQVLHQVLTYNHSLQARYVAMTNGLEHHYYHIHRESGQLQPLAEVPLFS